MAERNIDSLCRCRDSGKSGRNEGKLHFNLIGRRNSKLSQRKRSGKVPSRCNRIIEPALSQLSANGLGVLDKKEREVNPTGHWKGGLNASIPTTSRQLLSIE